MISGFSELLVSLTIQCTLLLLTTRFLVTRTRIADAPDRLWSWCHLLILLMSLVGMLLPHARLFRNEALLNICHQATASPALQKFWTGVFWLWCLVAAALVVNMHRSLIQTSRMLHNAAEWSLSSESTENGRSQVCLRETELLAAKLQVAGVHIFKSESCMAPFCWQLQKPVIVLPEFIEEFPPDELRAVIRHEFAHLQARHPMELFLQRLVEITFWFHPLVWHSSRDAAMQRELSADRRASSTRVEAVSFVKSLMRLSESFPGPAFESSIGLSLFTGGSSVMQRRVDQLLAMDWKQPGFRAPVSLRHSAARGILLLTFTAALSACLWIPLSPRASGRTKFSPWPAPTATLLHEAGIDVRDYELDGHRIEESFNDGD